MAAGINKAETGRWPVAGNRPTRPDDGRAERRGEMPEKFCDPNVCDCCQYIGEGDFFCDKHMEIVVEDWAPNEHYLMCAGEHDGKKQSSPGKPMRKKHRRKRSRTKKTRNGGTA